MEKIDYKIKTEYRLLTSAIINLLEKKAVFKAFTKQLKKSPDLIDLKKRLAEEAKEFYDLCVLLHDKQIEFLEKIE